MVKVQWVDSPTDWRVGWFPSIPGFSFLLAEAFVVVGGCVVFKAHWVDIIIGLSIFVVGFFTCFFTFDTPEPPKKKRLPKSDSRSSRSSSRQKLISEKTDQNYEEWANNFLGRTRLSILSRASLRGKSQLQINDYEGLKQPRHVVLGMVGLPARGKSFLAHNLVRYLRWLGVPTEIFNVGNYRRKKGLGGADANFFKDKKKSKELRESLAMKVLEDMYEWLDYETQDAVAIFDATNSTFDRRQKIINRAKEELGVELIFVESICDDPQILEQNIKSKLQNDDYKNMDPELALVDFRERIKAYEAVYQPIEDSEDDNNIAYIKTYNVGQKITSRNCTGYLTSNISFYLANIHICKRKVWIVPIASSIYHEQGIMGQDTAKLSGNGIQYVSRISKFFEEQMQELQNDDSFVEGKNISIHLGTSKNDRQTVSPLIKSGHYVVKYENGLNELDPGDFGGLTKKQLATKYPILVEARGKNKLNFRYPGEGGESYMDLIGRLQQVVIDIERERGSVIIVSQVAVRRCLFGYFLNEPIENIPHIEVNNNEIIEITLSTSGLKNRIVKVDLIQET